MRKLLAAMLVLGLIYGCSNISSSKKALTGQNAPAINGPLLARVNGWALGINDFNGYLDSLKPLAKAQKLNINDAKFKKRLLNDLVTTQILAQIAKKKGMDKDGDVKKAVRDYESSLLASKIKADLEKKITVSDTEAKTFYEQNKKFLRKPKEIKLREIVVSTESQAKNIYIQVLQGTSFASLATQYSVAKSAKKGGDLGYISYDSKKRFKKFWEVVLALDKGSISSIFKGNDGKYYIVKAEDIKGGQEIPFSEVKKQLKASLKKDRMDKELNKIMDTFKSKANVQINEDLLK